MIKQTADAKKNQSTFPHFSTSHGEHVLSAGTAERRMYWLQQLQKARREFAMSAGSRASVNSQVCMYSVLVTMWHEGKT